MRKQELLHRILNFENLEDRSMLSVTAFLSGTKLEIIGTPANESVQAYQSGVKWIVQGIAGTKVNGSTAAQKFSGVTDMVAALGAGNDYLQVFNGTLSGQLTVVYEPTDTGTKTTILTNLKLGSVQVANFTDGSNIIAATGIRTSAGGADFDTGNGNDAISLANLNLVGNLQVTAGNGINVIVAANVRTTGGGTDVIETGSGSDTIALSQYKSDDALDVMSGGGTDAVALNAVQLGSNVLYIDVGPGNQDSLVVTNSTAGLAEFLDSGGTNGYLTGSGNHFGTTDIDPNFVHRVGDLKS
jgi:hypothetical protein